MHLSWPREYQLFIFSCIVQWMENRIGVKQGSRLQKEAKQKQNKSKKKYKTKAKQKQNKTTTTKQQQNKKNKTKQNKTPKKHRFQNKICEKQINFYENLEILKKKGRKKIKVFEHESSLISGIL